MNQNSEIYRKLDMSTFKQHGTTIQDEKITLSYSLIHKCIAYFIGAFTIL